MNNKLVNWKNTFPRFPSIVNTRTFEQFWDRFFDEMDSLEKASECVFGTNQVVPYDVRNVKKDGKVVGTEMIYTLAGYSPEEVSVEVDDANNTITIDAKSVAKSEDSSDKYEYVRKGIAHRSIHVSYHLDGINKEGITAKFANGVLTVYLPSMDSKKTIPEKRCIAILKE